MAAQCGVPELQKCPPNTHLLLLGSIWLQLSKEIFYYIGLNSCAIYNEAVTGFIVLPEFSVIQILLAITNSFNKLLMKCLFLL